MTKKQIFESIINERNNQEKKWGKQLHSASEWMLILGEEYGEVLREANDWEFKKDKEARLRMKEELIQMVSVGVQILERYFR